MSSPTPEPVDWLAFFQGETPKKTTGPLEPGCDHDFLKFPIVEFNVRYLCGRCCGEHVEPFSSANIGLSFEQIDAAVAARFGGRVTHELLMHGLFRALNDEAAST